MEKRHMSRGYWILDGHTPVPTNDIEAWSDMLSDYEKREVACTKIDDVTVSTVFLGLDHSFFFNGPPLIFETMIFGGEYDGHTDRYSTWEEAEQGHHKACRLAFGGITN